MADGTNNQETNLRPPPPRRRAPRALVVLLILVGLGISAFVINDQVHLRRLLSACRHPDVAVRVKALSHFADHRDARVSSVLAEVLVEESDPAALDMAGCTAMRIEDTALLDTLKRRASEAPDNGTRAKLIMYTARLSRRDVRLIPWLEAGVGADQEPWRQFGSAAGLLYVGDYSGFVYCFDAATGHLHWRHDTKGHIWGSPLVADGKVYIGNEDGYLTILAASKLLRERVPDAEVRLYTDGRAEDYAAWPAVRHFAPLPHAQMRQALQEADAALCLYRPMRRSPAGFYNSSLKLFDYMAAGLPVVASALGQICEVVDDGVNGYLVGDDPRAVAEALAKLAESPERARQMGAAARDTVIAGYTWDHVGERIQAVFDSLGVR